MNRVFADRREKVRELMHEQNLEALLVSYDANRYYLSGFELHDPQLNESSGYILLKANGKDMLFTDSRYYDAALRLWDKDKLHIYKGLAAAPQEINQLLAGTIPTGKFVGFESKIMSVAFFEKFSKNLPLQPADGLIEKLRIIKDSSEIECLRASVKLNHQLMDFVPQLLGEGRSEQEIAWDIEKFFRENGASENAFSPIVAIGPNAALPHAIPGTKRITADCPVLIDVGARLRDYNSDQTRTFWAGNNPSPDFKLTLKQVKTAQQLAIQAIRPGVPCRDIYFVALDYLRKQGVASYFTHGLGHGVGLETHEAPSLGSSSQQILQSGMVVTVEPGLYYPEWGGVRWEYMVLVTEDGCEIL